MGIVHQARMGDKAMPLLLWAFLRILVALPVATLALDSRCNFDANYPRHYIVYKLGEAQETIVSCWRFSPAGINRACFVDSGWQTGRTSVDGALLTAAEGTVFLFLCGLECPLD